MYTHSTTIGVSLRPASMLRRTVEGPRTRLLGGGWWAPLDPRTLQRLLRKGLPGWTSVRSGNRLLITAPDETRFEVRF